MKMFSRWPNTIKEQKASCVNEAEIKMKLDEVDGKRRATLKVVT